MSRLLRRYIILLLYRISLVVCATITSTKRNSISKIAFGSCNQQDRPQPLWDAIIADKPDLFVWLGDAIYSDRRHWDGLLYPIAVSEVPALFQAQKARPEYQKLLASVPVVGGWDDHDYGEDDGGASFADKEEVQK
eukprot:520251_1